MSRHVLGILLLLAIALLGGCKDDRDKPISKQVFNEEGAEDPVVVDEVKAKIDLLKSAATLDDPESEATFYKAMEELTKQGSAIEYLLIEALNGHKEWGVRLGVIHVLDSVGTRRSIDALIAALRDDHPLVAHKAMHTLRVLCKHREVPETGKPVGENKLPPVPEHGANQLADNDTLLWTRWFTKHGDDLHRSWRDWWAVNKRKTAID